MGLDMEVWTLGHGSRRRQGTGSPHCASLQSERYLEKRKDKENGEGANTVQWYISPCRDSFQGFTGSSCSSVHSGSRADPALQEPLVASVPLRHCATVQLHHCDTVHCGIASRSQYHCATQYVCIVSLSLCYCVIGLCF